MRSHPSVVKPVRRSGFTLVELLIVVSIMLILATITITSINFNMSRDRVREAGRQLQSFIAGARDRAIFAKEIRGVRLILDPLNRHTAVAVQYVGAAERWSDGEILFDPAGDKIQLRDSILMQNLGLFSVGSQIEIPKNSGNYCTIASRVITGGGNWIQLSKSFPQYANTSVSYALLMPPTPLPGSNPVPLPTGVVIDLDGSSVPFSWRPSLTNTALGYSSNMDILFNPRGAVAGDVAGNGILHLHLADSADVVLWQTVPGRIQMANPSTTQWSPPIVPANGTVGTPIVTRDQILVSLNGRTGNVSVHHVNPTNVSPADQVADDPYSFAETGQVSN
ncbi:pilus assembly FimT family protein [Schlesneria sp.]|uniref:pilus assembly FimT family protein n=1 Tax=Schlesneria sp. TaxID=2762018 RepID=UPI002EDC9DE8